MNEELESTCLALEAFSANVLSSWSSDGTMTEALGWHSPALTRTDLASFPLQLARDLRSASPDAINESLLPLLRDVPRRLSLLQGNTVPQMFGGNSPQAVPAYINTFVGIRALLSELLDWQVINDPKSMPAALSRRVRSINAELESLAPKKEDLERQLLDIKRAHAAAESLPIDLQALAEARKSVADSAQESAIQLRDATNHASECQRVAEEIAKIRKEAAATLLQSEEAYRASTSRGLAAAFHQRASRLGWSIVGWIAGLLFALIAGGYLGLERVKTLSDALAVPDPHWGVVAMHFVLSIACIGAPIWFAWLATKQIGQRFRLAEDYSFKAAVARAYEGYRREAARIDPDLEKRLFESALARLEEAPLRLIEASSHGSPWHELVGSEAFKKAVDLVPELGEKVSEIAKVAVSTIGRKKTKEVPEVVD